MRDKQIELRILKLKEEFNRNRENYIYKTYLILDEIFELRRKQFKRYSIADLAKEDGLDLTYHSIVYIFRLKDISPKTKKLIDKKVLRATSAIQLIKNTSAVRNDHDLQDKLVDKFLKGEVSIKQVSKMSKDNLINFIDAKYSPIEEKCKVLLRSIYEIKCIANVINSNRTFLRQKKYMNKLIENNRILQLAINSI